jgi:parvulin-like peptidyl-prolyl isomerase
LALGAFFVVAAGLSACGSGVPGNAVANVAGNPITAQAFDHWMYVAEKGQSAQSPGAPVIVPDDPPGFSNCISQVRAQIPTLAKTADATIKKDCGQLFTSLNGQVMDFLIKAYWYQAEAHKLGIKITPAQVTAALNQAKKQQFPTAAQFQTFLKQTGQTQADIQYRVLISQVVMKLSKRFIKPVTTAQIASYYAAHKTQYGTQASRNADMVRTKTQAQALAAKAALAKGQSWAAVAKKYSLDPSKSSGGVLTGVTPTAGSNEEPAFTKALFAAPANKLVGPIKGQFGYYLLKVTKITKGTQQPLTAVSTQIKQVLTQQQQQAAQTKATAQAKKDWFHKTTCRGAFAMADCPGYKPPKTNTTTTPPSSTAPTSTSAPSTTSTPSSTTASPSATTSSTTPTTTTTKKK